MKAGSWALPYEFSRFDHQPTIDEVVGFQSVTFDRAVQATTRWQRTDVIILESLFERGFRCTSVTPPPPGLGDQTAFTVKGGLMSGLRSASAVGNGWNTVLGETAWDLANRFRGHGRKLDTWQIVRSDDTQVVSGSYRNRLAAKLGSDILGAEANESDSANQLEPCLMTPVPGQPALNTPEGRINSAHVSTRLSVEHCISVLNSSFRCL
ncbi:hypothetical protein HPB49_003750 [Dermacentor silvarum]|uniref:Uncharacterized protein n=1 Tax=Dermacentor silvarum TaxID=543639 RepID=A0ACB8CDF0_DERSI|nr:hypothetical protein HPB49_003750 [Dermacentor silvarum]